MLVVNTTDKIEIVIGANTTNAVHIYASYNQISSTAVTPVKNSTTIATTSAVDVVPAPSAGNQHQLRYCNIFNADVAPVTVTIRTNYNGTTRNVISVTLQVNDYLQYTHRTGWKAFGFNGDLRITDSNAVYTDLMHPELINSSFTTALTINNTFCVYLGRATNSYRYITLSQNYTVAAASVTWGEIAIYKGTFNVGQNVSLTRCGNTGSSSPGWVDMSSIWTRGATSYAITVPVSGITPGDDLWMVVACNAGTNIVLRKSDLVDYVGAGFMQSTASLTRPSTSTTLSPTIYTTNGAILTPWSGQ